jgi:hypothetical protein
MCRMPLTWLRTYVINVTGLPRRVHEVRKRIVAPIRLDAFELPRRFDPKITRRLEKEPSPSPWFRALVRYRTQTSRSAEARVLAY